MLLARNVKHGASSVQTMQLPRKGADSGQL